MRLIRAAFGEGRSFRPKPVLFRIRAAGCVFSPHYRPEE